jgi:alkyl hydroperoxide reductase subunit D
MTIQTIRESLGDFAKDIKINLGNVLSEEGAPELTLAQIHAVALASAYATRNPTLIAAMEAEVAQDRRAPAKLAASLMAMNNVYYRFVHLVGDADYGRMPAGLRMQGMANPGIDKIDFELMSLAVSAINGCGMCMESHTKTLEKHSVSKVAVQSSIRIAAVINATAQALVLG